MKSILKKCKDFLSITNATQDNQAGLFIPHRQTSWLTAGLLITLLGTFFLGYLWGYKCAIDNFLITAEQESFADKINYSLYTMNDLEIGEFETKEEDNGIDSSDASEQQDEQSEQAPEALNTQDDNEILACESVGQVVQEISATVPKVTKVYVAPLAGFGTLQAAQAFAKKIQTIDPYAIVKKRVSKTARGRTVAWYQAVTGEFDSEEKLQAVLEQLKQKEHLKDLKIIEKRKAFSS